jgi:hypothetical protein
MDIPYNSALLNRVELKLTNGVSTYPGSMSVGGCPKCKGATLFKPASFDSNCDTLVVGGGSTDPNDFNVVLISATLSPKEIPVGGTTTLSVSLQNTGAVQAPAGCIVEILANDTVVGETPALPVIPAGEYYNFNGTLQASSEGQATICARIKSGYYNTLPQQKCDTITVGDVPVGNFYIELQSVTMDPNQANVGEPVNMIIMLANTGTETAPAGWILQIKKNGTVVGESQPAPAVLAGHTVRGDVNFTETVTGTYTFCARIKEGYYSIPPQEKCATLTVGQLTGGIVNVSSTPSGASVYMDSFYHGVTPVSLENVEPGQHSILIRKDGYKDYNTTITVAVGVVTTVAATLVEEGVDPEPVPTNIFLLLGIAGVGLLGGIMMTSDKDKYKPKSKK